MKDDKIIIVGGGRNCGRAYLQYTINEINKLTSLADMDDFYSKMNDIKNGESIPTSNLEEKYVEIEPLYNIDDEISSLKKQLKHAKNYLEKTNINRRLNELYVEKRRMRLWKE